MRSRRGFLVVTACCVALGQIVGAGRVAGALQTATEPSVTLRIIVAATADAAQRLADRLARGESFPVLAQAESTAPSAASGGWLGKLPVSQLRPEVRQALQGVTAGHVTPVVRITSFAAGVAQAVRILTRRRGA